MSEFILAVLLSAPTAIVVFVAAVLIKCTSRGPVFYRQTRVGKDGRTFALIKLRTMVHNAEALTGPIWSTPADNRITPIGRVLRACQIDEFPQLINVLLGQMSLIGPRPERPEFVGFLEREIPNYRQRHNLRPGVTGLAQLRLPPDSDLDSVRRKTVHDLYYVYYANPWLDGRIAVSTVAYFLSMTLKIPFSLFRLPAHDTIRQSVEALLDPDVQPTLASAVKGSET